MSAEVLLLADNSAVRDAVLKSLTEVGYVVAVAGHEISGARANTLDGVSLVVAAFRETTPTVIAHLSGVIARRSDCPLLVVAVQGDEVSILRAGADSYLAHPYPERLLLARVESLMRCVPRRLRAAPLLIDVPSRVMRRNAMAIHLSVAETTIIAELVAAGSAPVTRAILAAASGARSPKSSALTQNVSRLRRKLQMIQGGYIVGVRGGYAFVPTVPTRLIED